jgi:DNA/RNA-binding domain of Phe-tRNA-synthetase-like protein
MRFSHSSAIWRDHPDLVPGVLAADRIAEAVSVDERRERFAAVARERLASQTEGELPEIQAWRRTFSRMGLKPTQYRCASESLLRRFRQEGSLPQIHPLIDLCNAVSLAFAIPIAVFDVEKVTGRLQVRHADGSETYAAFSGEIEHPVPGEVIFADEAGRAHARRWTHRQSAESAVGTRTSTVLIVAEALHDTATADVPRVVETLADELRAVWHATPRTAVLTASSPVFESD